MRLDRMTERVGVRLELIEFLKFIENQGLS